VVKFSKNSSTPSFEKKKKRNNQKIAKTITKKPKKKIKKSRKLSKITNKIEIIKKVSYTILQSPLPLGLNTMWKCVR